MPYIALQLVGIEAVVKTIGVEGDLPIIIAFAVLAAYTYSSGLRAPALIAFVKDTLIYIVVIVAIIVIPIKLGGFDDIFAAAEREVLGVRGARTTASCSSDAATLGYSTLAFGSALALFLYPHTMTGRARGAEPQHDQAEHGGPARLHARARPARAARLHGDRRRASRRSATTRTRSSRCCSTTSSRTGSRASRSARSRSARWCPPRSWRSPPRTSSRATSTRST